MPSSSVRLLAHEHDAVGGLDIVLTYRQAQGEAARTLEQIAAHGGCATALPLEISRVESFDAFAGAPARDLAGRPLTP